MLGERNPIASMIEKVDWGADFVMWKRHEWFFAEVKAAKRV